MKKTISPARRNLRRVLISTLVISALFFSAMVYIRTHDKLRYGIAREYKNELFHIDVFQYHVLSFFQDDDKKRKTALRLMRKGFFSRIYSNAGIAMLQDLADSGHAASQVSYGDYLMLRYPLEENKLKATQYYELAAQQGHLLAKERLQSL